jgi:hypothetical protein
MAAALACSPQWHSQQPIEEAYGGHGWRWLQWQNWQSRAEMDKPDIKSIRVLRGPVPQPHGQNALFAFPAARSCPTTSSQRTDGARRRCDFLAVAPQPRARSRTWQIQPRCASEQRRIAATSAERSIRPLASARPSQPRGRGRSLIAAGLAGTAPQDDSSLSRHACAGSQHRSAADVKQRRLEHLWGEALRVAHLRPPARFTHHAHHYCCPASSPRALRLSAPQ